MNIIQDFIPVGRENRPGLKKCKKCGEEKPLSCFYAQRQKPDGKHPWCKECCKSWRREHREEINARERERWANDLDYRQRRRIIHRQWGRIHAEHKQKYERRRRELFPEEYKERNRRYAEKNPEMVRYLARIRQIVQRALKAGNLIRPDRCEWCSMTCKPEAAHYDYERPLDVTWLCRSCHAQWDYWQPKYRKGEVKANGNH